MSVFPPMFSFTTVLEVLLVAIESSIEIPTIKHQVVLCPPVLWLKFAKVFVCTRLKKKLDFEKACSLKKYFTTVSDHSCSAVAGPCQTSKMERFSKVVNGFQPLIFYAKRSILDISQGSECSCVFIIFSWNNVKVW